MDKKYLTLFREMAQATAALAEAVVEHDRENNDEEGLKNAETMRDNFQSLSDSLKEAGDSYKLTKSDAAHLLIASTIQVSQLQNKIDALKVAMTGYDTDVIPKLSEIVEASSDDEAAQLGDEKFVIVEK